MQETPQSLPRHRESLFLQRPWDTPSATPSLSVEVCIIFSLLPTTAGSHHSPTLSFLDHKSKNRNSSLRISRGKGEGEMAATKKLANKRWALIWSCCETNFFFFYNSLSLFNPFFFRIILPLFSFFPLAFLLPTLCHSPSLLSPLSFSLKVIFRRSGSSVSCRLRRGRRDGQAHLLQCKAWHQCAKWSGAPLLSDGKPWDAV